MGLSIQFLGGVGTVTGSKFLLASDKKKILVDCGMFQGLKNLRLQNWAPLPIDAAEIDSVILTHAHLDHSGYLPLLVKNGFSGKIHCSGPTREITEIILRDAAKIQEEDTEKANRLGYSKHKPALPLYGLQDAEKTFSHFKVEPIREWVQLGSDFRFRFQPSGHMLGSVFIELESGGKRVVFSGDLGRQNPLTLEAPAQIEDADYLLIESTYGDRRHPDENPLTRFSNIVNDAVGRGGQVLIPCFAVGRAQELLYLFSQLKASRAIPNIPIYLDSPMAIQTTKVFHDFPEWHRLGKADLEKMEREVIYVSEAEASRGIQNRREPAIVIAGSGMMTGGRILGHAYNKLGSSKNTFVLVGYQAAGTSGRFLRDGANEIKMFGEYVSVHARVEEITSLSAHADQYETIQWLKGFSRPPKKTFIVHGEPHSADALRVRVKDALGWQMVVPEMGSTYRLD